MRAFNVTRGTLLCDRGLIARTEEQRRRGWLGRHHLITGEGLYIPRCSSVHTLGMQLPIDILFLAGSTVVGGREFASPGNPRISYEGWGDSVLELPAGTIQTTGTSAGDRLQIEF